MSAHIGVTGLAVMGANLARNFARNGYTVAVHNRTPARTEELLAQHGSEGEFIATQTLKELVDSLERPRRVLIMVKAGSPVDDVIAELVPLLEKDDIIIDAGNSNFEDTRRREAALASLGLHFVGIGVSGGEEGALNGPSIMPGGSRQSYDSLGPMLEKIAADFNGEPCCNWVGTDGSGHYVKMVHNGIEYADMQVIGESFHLMREAAGVEPAEQAEIFERWNSTELKSYLIEITSRVLAQKDERTGGPFVDVVVDSAGQKGTGRWTVVSGLEIGAPVSAIAESVFARGLSSQREQRGAATAMLPPGVKNQADAQASVSIPESMSEQFIEDVRLALLATKLVSYAQGVDMLAKAAEHYSWDLKMSSIFSLWRAGCIIRADILDTMMKAYSSPNPPENLLLAEQFRPLLDQAVPAWRRVVSHAALHGIPVPVMASSLSYYDALRSPRLPAALIQGQRDLFGAHTYERVDSDGSFHVQWSGDHSEVRMDSSH